MKNKTKKVSKEDLVAIALYSLAVKYCKMYHDYTLELIEHISKGKSKVFIDDIENWIWSSIIDGESYEQLKEHLKTNDRR